MGFNLSELQNLSKEAMRKEHREVLTVPIERVRPKEQVRKKFRDIEELGKSILSEGQQSPIITYPANEDGEYIIQKGERRWRAIQHAGIATIDLIVNEKPQTDLDETAGALIENIQRDDLTPMEIAQALQKFVDANWKQTEIADRLGKAKSFVSTHLALLRIPDCVMELYEGEVTEDPETLNCLRQLYEIDEVRCKAVCASAIESGISRRQARDLLEEARLTQSRVEATKRQSAAKVKKEPITTIEQENKATQEKNSPSTQGENSNDSGKELDPPGSDATQDNSGQASDNSAKDWKYAQAQDLIITVNIVTENKVKRGILLLDRVCNNPGEVWVKIVQGRKEKNVRVAVQDLEFVSLSSV